MSSYLFLPCNILKLIYTSEIIIDALAGGALAGSIEGGAPTLLVAPKAGHKNYYAVDNYLTEDRAATITNAYILGGSAAMPTDTITKHVCDKFGQTVLP